MIKLQYYNGQEWTTVSEWNSAYAAWVSLGEDTLNYRSLDAQGNVIVQNKKD